MQDRCKNCISWTRAPTSDAMVIFHHPGWLHDLWDYIDYGPPKGYARKEKCNICGKEFGIRSSQNVQAHIIREHKKILDGLRNERVGICCNEHFKYEDPYEEYRTQNSPKEALFYMDGEECGAGFFTDEDFGCVHFRTKNGVSRNLDGTAL